MPLLTLPSCFAGYSDRYVRAMASSGNLDAKAELVKRGLAYDPALLKQARTPSAPKEHDYGWTSR